MFLVSTSTEPKCQSPVEHLLDEPPEKKCRVGEWDLQSMWLQLDGSLLTEDDKEQLGDGRWLNVKNINFAQTLPRKQFPNFNGLRDTLLLHREQEKIKQGVTIHW